MNVLHVVGGLPSEDNPHIQPFIKSQIESLTLKGLSIEVLDIMGYKSPLNYLKSIKKIRKILKEKKIDIIHAHYTYCGLTTILANTRLPIILSLLGSDLQGTVNPEGKITLRGRIDRIITKIISNLVNIVIVKSAKMKEKLNSRTLTKILPNGVNFHEFRPDDMLKCRKELNLKSNYYYALFLANPHSYVKNYKLAEQSVKIFKQKYQIEKIELLTVYGLPHQEIAKFLNACNVLVFTSFWEGSPNVVKEAMACNLPIVSVDVGDVKEVISNTRNCFITGYDPNEISEKLYMIFKNGERSDGRTKIEHLKSETIAEKLINIYKDCLNSKN